MVAEMLYDTFFAIGCNKFYSISAAQVITLQQRNINK